MRSFRALRAAGAAGSVAAAGLLSAGSSAPRPYPRRQSVDEAARTKAPRTHGALFAPSRQQSAALCQLVQCQSGESPDTAQSPPLRTLYPPIEPYKTFHMKTRDGLHELYVEEVGNPNGKPALFLHGGPAAGISPSHRQLYDPNIYRIILLDQRGAGKSRPNASLENNTTWHLVDDLEHLREELNIERWHVIYGGSWGSTLALAYAQRNATRVASMVLRGIFLFDHEDMAWLFEQGGASELFPDKFDKYRSIIPQGERGSLINAYYRRLTSENEKTRLQAAAHFVEWELSISKARALSDEAIMEELKDPAYILPFARAETHYFVHGGWFGRPRQLLDDCSSIEHIPVAIVHGRYDIVCRPRMAWELHKRLPLSTIEFADTSGHSGMEPITVDATIRALDRFGAMPA
eukprot:TRINITY_DN15048_c0_g1_i2.p1 TRINITY_DN15048_c0_g1~~TRINITY_DN15048_c0_g1_i2.p1  ORF type:complete len:406 (+),score=87.10 TRINITY_DN15048_c0_g1_i2:59-1276(+)